MGWLKDFQQRSLTLANAIPPVSDNQQIVQDAIVIQQGFEGGNAQSLPAVYRSMQMLTDMVAAMPLKAVDPKTNLFLEDVPNVLRKPDPNITQIEFTATLMSSLLFRGNAYLYVPLRDENGRALAFMVINPDDVQITENAAKTEAFYHWTTKDIPLVPGVNLVHIPINTWPGQVKGHGPITAARQALSGYQSLEHFAQGYFRGSGIPTGTLTTPAPVTKTEADDLKSQWSAAHDSKRSIAVLSGGIEFKPLQLSAEDQQFIQTREFQVADVARLFGIPAPLLGVSSGDSLTYATTESVVRWLIVTTLRPTYLERVEQSISTMLPRTQDAFFDTRSLLRADTQTRFTAWQTAIESGFMTPNEVREQENLTAKEGGNELGGITRDEDPGAGVNNSTLNGGAGNRGADDPLRPADRARPA